MPRLLTTTAGPALIGEDGQLGLLKTVATDVRGLIEERGGDLTDLPAVRSWVGPADVSTLAPVTRPSAFWAVGGSYPGHPNGDPHPTHPRFFLVAPSSVIGTGEAIQLPAAAPDHVDYEGELVIVVGKRMRDVCAAAAWSHVAGVTLGNDVSARDVQRGRLAAAPGVENVALAKSFDTFSPLGPAIVTADEFDDVDDVEFSTYVDGELRQRSSTRALHFSVPEMLAFLSARVTLHPGDLVSTGSPVGNGEPTGNYLRSGSTVTVTSPLIGSLTNPVTAGSD